MIFRYPKGTLCTITRFDMVMRKISLLMVLLASGSIQSKTIMVGWIQYPKDIENPPSLYMFYKGREHPIDLEHAMQAPKKGFYEIYEQAAPAELYLVVTQDLQRPENVDELNHFRTSAQHPYRYFKLTRKKSLVEKKEVEFWDIQEQSHKEKVIELPDNTIIFWMNPAFIEKLESDTWQPGDSVIKLPRIIFNASITKEDLNEVAAQSLFGAFLDFRVLHKKITKTIIPYANNRVISLPNPQNRYIG